MGLACSTCRGNNKITLNLDLSLPETVFHRLLYANRIRVQLLDPRKMCCLLERELSASATPTHSTEALITPMQLGSAPLNKTWNAVCQYATVLLMCCASLSPWLAHSQLHLVILPLIISPVTVLSIVDLKSLPRPSVWYTLASYPGSLWAGTRLGTLVHEYVYCTVVLEPDPQKCESLAPRLTVLRSGNKTAYGNLPRVTKGSNNIPK